MYRNLCPLVIGAILMTGCASITQDKKAEPPTEKRVEAPSEKNTEATTDQKKVVTATIDKAKLASDEKKEYKEAVIETNKGKIVFKFYPEVAPNHVKNFTKLTKKKFYDGLTFHRVEPGFVIQGGCPNGNGTGGPGYTIKAEFNAKPHIKGTVAMARANHPDSAGSQFYICLGTASFLDGKYTVFGQVTEGQDVVDSIRIGDFMKKVSLR